MRTHSSFGIVLARKNYGEADRILTILTKSLGKIRVLAKGVRRPRSKKRGHIEVFSKIRLQISKGKSLDLLTEADLVDSYAEIRLDLAKASVAYYLCEVSDKIIREEEKHESVYENMANSLERIQAGESLRKVREDFVVNILVSLGFWPRGAKIDNIDKLLSEITERQMSTVRVGKRILV